MIRLPLSLLLWVLPLLGKDLHQSTLTFPDKDHALETVVPAIQGVWADATHLILIPEKQAFVLGATPNPPGGYKFGPLLNMKRQTFAEIPPTTYWHGVQGFAWGFLLLNGREMEVASIDFSFRHIQKRSLIWDRILPPRDRGGEAPTWEIAELRHKFARSLHAVEGRIFTAMTFLQTVAGKQHYYLLTRISGFPLVRMECSSDDPTQCAVTRACRIALPSNRDELEKYAGIAYSARRKELIIGHRTERRILVFGAGDCLGIGSEKRSLLLPEKLKDALGLWVDEQDRLLVTTQFPDDYHNASLYWWDKETW